MQGRIIECSFDGHSKTWIFMRERKDKETPNAYHVYEKVMRSIQDNITQELLLEHASEAVQKNQYSKDRQYAQIAGR